MELTIEKLKKAVTTENVSFTKKDMTEIDKRIRAYTVHVENQRILTIHTFSNSIANKWVSQILKSCKKNQKVLIGVCVDKHDPDSTYGYTYDIITLCVGSQCLIYDLPEPNEVRDGPFPLTALFSDSRVVAVGVKIEIFAENIMKDYGVKIVNVIDLNKMAEKVMVESYEMDLGNYDLDRLGMAVLGKYWYVDRPDKKVKWYEKCNFGYLLLEKVKFSTYDSYSCFSIGEKLVEMSEGGKKANKKSGGKNRIVVYLW